MDMGGLVEDDEDEFEAELMILISRTTCRVTLAKFSIPMGPRFMALSSMIVFIFDVSRDD